MMQRQAIDRAATITPRQCGQNSEEFWPHCWKELQQLGRKITQKMNSDRLTKISQNILRALLLGTSGKASCRSLAGDLELKS